MSEEILKVIDELAKRFGVAIDWTSENVMPQVTEMAERFVSYRIAVHSAGVAIGIALLIASVMGIRWMRKDFEEVKKTKKDGFFYESFSWGIVCTGWAPTAIIILIIAILLGGIAFFDNVFDVIKLVTIPELYIVEYLELLRG